MQLYRNYIQQSEMNICIKLVNIQEKDAKIFRVLQPNVFYGKTENAKYEQIVDRNSSGEYTVCVKMCKVM